MHASKIRSEEDSPSFGRQPSDGDAPAHKTLALEGHEQMFSTCGTTSLVVLITDKHVICCNTGDSRAVLASEGASRQLSTDHKPESVKERERYMSLFWGYFRSGYCCRPRRRRLQKGEGRGGEGRDRLKRSADLNVIGRDGRSTVVIFAERCTRSISRLVLATGDQ